MKLIFRTLLLCLIPASFAVASEADLDGRQIFTGGSMTVEGAGGGGFVPWALLAGNGEDQPVIGTAWYMHTKQSDFKTQAYGAADTILDRVELSVGKQVFDMDAVVPGEELEMTTIGAKVRVAGALTNDPLPQIAVGVQYKKNDSFAIPQFTGARDDSGYDVYVAASKLWLDGPLRAPVFLNTTLRATKANVTGLMGFGGDKNDDHELMAELSAGFMLSRQWLAGVEYRQKPDNLGFSKEDDWYDLYVTWTPNKWASVSVSWVDAGTTAGMEGQDAWSLTLKLNQ